MSVLLGHAKAFRALGLAYREQGERLLDNASSHALGEQLEAARILIHADAYNRAAQLLEEAMKRETSQPPPAIESPCAG